MKKTVTANIAGTVFHIEEDAYEQLQRYLAGIRANFSGSAGAEEIMTDIEARIAELFTDLLKGRDVVTFADVQNVEGVMGRPEDFAGEKDEPGPAEGAAPPPLQRKHKRLFRDPEDKWIGGVLSGLGHYIGMDPIWLRIAVVVLVYFSFGSLILIYILLWILVPKAETAAEKLEMRGEPVNVENIKRVFEESAERFKQGGERVAKEAQDLGKEWAPKAQRWTSEASQRMEHAGRGAANVIGKLIGVVLIVIGFSALLGLITGVAGGTWSLWSATSAMGDLGLLDLGGLLFTSSIHAMWFGIGVVVLLLVPVIGLLLAGFRLLIGSHAPRWLTWTLSILWFSALVPVTIAAVDLGMDFRQGSKVINEQPITQPLGGVIYLDSFTPQDSAGHTRIGFSDGDIDIDLDGLQVEDGLIRSTGGQCDVQASDDSLYHLIVMREARSHSTKLAAGRADQIRFRYQQNGDVLLLSPEFSWPQSDKLRSQYVRFTLKVPLGGSVYLRKGSGPMLNDIHNVTNTDDDEMTGRKWTMTSKGLEDLGAPKEENDGDNEKKEDAYPKDTSKHTPVAAIVWPGTPAAKPTKPVHAAPARRTTVTTEPGESVQLPNLFAMLGSIVHL